MRTWRRRVRNKNKPMRCQVACREDGLLFFDSAEELFQHDMLGWGDGVSVDEFELTSRCSLKLEPTAFADDSDPRRKRPKTLLCHDMRGGYLDYDRLGGAALDPECHPYTLMHWWYIDVFVYFSHHFVSPPPLTWIRQSHCHGVPALGTLITEFDKGEELCRELFATAERAEELASKLVWLCKKYCFDGWLVNIENAINKRDLQHLTSFLCKLREGLKAEVGPHSMVVWYDSITSDGELKWQNELNELNSTWFNLTDAIFVNYTWKEKNLAASVRNALDRRADVYVGVDVFGRGCLGDGGWNCRLPVKLIREYGLGLALFAPGWISETCADECVFESSAKFWANLRGLVYPHSLTSRNTSTNFNVGHRVGDATTPTTFCAADVQIQPHLLESEGQLEMSRNGLLLRDCMDYVTLFLCDIPVIEPTVIKLRSTTSVMIRVCMDDDGRTTFIADRGEVEIIPTEQARLRIKRIELKKCPPESDENTAILSFSVSVKQSKLSDELGVKIDQIYSILYVQSTGNMANQRGEDGERDDLNRHVDAVAAAPERILHYDNAMLLRILNQSVKYRFFNASGRTVDVAWMHTETDSKWYKQLPRRTFLDIETFAGHKWRFLDAQDGTPLLAFPGGSADFIAAANFSEEDRLKRRVAVVAEDMSRVSLKLLAMRRLAQLLHPTSLQHYPGYLPAMLIIELADYFIQCTDYQAKLHPGVEKKREETCRVLNRIRDLQRSHFIEE